MDFTTDKLLRRLMEVSGYRYLNRQPIEPLFYVVDETKKWKYVPDLSEEWKEYPREKLYEGRDHHVWLKSRLTIPHLEKKERAVVLLDFTKFISGRIRELEGFEAMAFINGKPYQGMDQNHKELFLDSKYSDQKIDLAFMLWTGLEAGGIQQKIEHRLNSLDCAILSEDTDDFYFNAKTLFKTIYTLEEKQPERDQLLNVLDKAFYFLDWSLPGSEPFYKSIRKANHYLTNELNQMENIPSSKVTGIGHTHIDVAWLWQLKHTRGKSARSFATVLRLMEQYPEYIFLQSQPQLYEYIKEDYPEIYQQMKKRIKEGRWEADGAMWLEPDCNVPSGESLVRQILYGTRFFDKEFGVKANYLWMPDVFGYSWALPQILRKSGIDMFMTTKLSWNQYNRMPNDTFIWRGIDGSEVYTHFITTPNPNSTDDAVGAVYSGLMEPATVKGIYRNYNNKSLNQDLLLAYGHGDGGGGTDREMIETLRRMQMYQIPTLPKVETGTAAEYFKELKETLKQAPENEVAVWDGELYLEYHRGTYTSQAHVKKNNRRLELLYRDIELLSSILHFREQLLYPAQEINNGWKIILRNQFHDILPGCAIPEVYEDNQREYQEAYEIAENILKTIEQSTENVMEWTIVNTASWARSELIAIPYSLKENEQFVDRNGEVLPSEKVNDKSLIEIKDIQAFGDKKILVKRLDVDHLGKTATAKIKKDNQVETSFYIIEWNNEGHLTRIFDKDYSREVLKQSGNVFQLFEDKPMAYDAWDIDIYYQEKGRNLKAESIEIRSNTSFYTSIRFKYVFGESTISQDMILYPHTRQIDFKTKIHWQERQQLLKVGFDVDIRSTEATYDIQFGNVKRPTHWNTSWDRARFESVGHQWVDLSEHGYGVSLLNDAKYGHDIKDSQVRLTLLTGAINPDPSADIGEHSFIYSLLPHKGEFLSARTPEKAWELNNPLRILKGDRQNVSSFMFFESEDSVFVDAVKKAEDQNGLLIRLHDHTGGRREVTVSLTVPAKEWVETNLLEEEIGEVVPINDGKITFTLHPFEIKTLLIR